MSPRQERWNELGAAELAPLLARREISAETLVRACLERIAEREPAVQAWEFLDPVLALDQARALDRGPVTGPLHGLTIGVKDIFDTHDMPTCHGSPIYAGHRPAADAAPVALARRAGGLILGKTVTTEFATFTPSRTRNPRNTAHTPAGSSSGSAAAVADLMVPLAFGTQTAGSVIRPAAYCGCVGYKPSYNTLPRAGVKSDADTLDTVGVYGRSVADVALFTAALSGRPLDQPVPQSAPRIGLLLPRVWGTIEAPMEEAMQDAAACLGAAGVQVREVLLPEPFAGLREAHTSILWYEVAHSLADEWRRHPDKFSQNLGEHCARGYEFDVTRYETALALGRACRESLAALFAGCDVIIAPGATGEAPLGLEATGDPSMNVVWTLLHVPAVVLPWGRGERGLPLSVQVLGRIGEDSRTLACARWIERTLNAA